MNEYVKEERARVRAEQKQQWKSLTPAQKAGYFKDYYLKQTLAAAAIVIFIIYMVVNFLSPKEQSVFTAAVFDEVMTEDGKAQLEQEIYDRLSPGEREYVRIDDSYHYNNPEDLQRISLMTQVRQIEIVVADSAVIEEMAGIGYFIPLEEVLTDDELLLWDSFLLRTAGYDWDQEGTDPATGPVQAYGLHIGDSAVYRAAGAASGDPVAAVVMGTKYEENAAEILRMLMGE